MALENLVGYAANNPVNITVSAIGDTAGTEFQSVKELMEGVLAWFEELEAAYPSSKKAKKARQAAKDWGGALSSIADAILGGLEALAALADYGGTELTRFDAFFGDWQIVMSDVLEYIAVLDKQAPSQEAAEEWGGALKSVADALVSGLEVLTGLVDYVSPSLENIEQFAQDFFDTIRQVGSRLVDTFFEVEEQGLTEAVGVFWDSIGSFASTLEGAVSALIALSEYVQPTMHQMTTFALDFWTVTVEMARYFADSFYAMEEAGLLEAVGVYWQSVESFASALTSAVDLMTKLAEYIPPSMVQVRQFAADFNEVFGAVLDQLQEIHLDEETREAMEAITVAAEALNGLLGALVDFNQLLADFEGIAWDWRAFARFIVHLGDLLEWAEDLHNALAKMAAYSLALIDTEANEAMDALAEATESLDACWGRCLGWVKQFSPSAILPKLALHGTGGPLRESSFG